MNKKVDNLKKLLEGIYDPEIPVVNIIEMGIVRNVCFDEAGKLNIEITPTYSGCPAMKMIEDEIKELAAQHGYTDAVIKKVYAPAWTTDWLSVETKTKLKNFGISPPGKTIDHDFLTSLKTKVVACPYCNSKNTKLTSEFSSTACKSLHFCNECRQPFEHFKCI